MNTITKSFSPSVNIVRDFEKSLDYIPTPNAQGVFSKITNDYLSGIRSFNIIGAYGTGKSSFLWAFEKVINQKKDYFPINNFFKKKSGYEAINLVGDFASIIEVFAHEFNAGEDYTTSSIIQAIDKIFKSREAENKGLIIYVDEFGKFLEFAAKNNPEQELYFIQQLAEYVNDVDKDIFFITTLHQDFNSYSYGLTRSQRNEWNKVDGRLKDITFNEPVEQLLYLASERLENFDNKGKKKNFQKLFNSIKNSKAFPLRDYLNEEIAEKLLPFDILAASLLTLALQKYGQNERSLFSFIESHDILGIREFQNETPYYNISSIYDFLIQNYPILATRYNPHSSQWAAIKIAVERVDGVIEKDVVQAIQLVKTIGLLNIFASASAQIDEDFLSDYGKYSLGIRNPKSIIKDLIKYKIIRYVKHTNKFILFEGTDLDIEYEIDNAGTLVERVTNVVDYLKMYFDFPYILAKAVYFKVGTPRFFEFKLTESPITDEPEGEIDGFINLIFSSDVSAKEIKKISGGNGKAIIYGWYKNTQEISHLIFEIQKVQKVLEGNKDDKVAKRELNSILDHQIALLNHYVLDSIYSPNSSIEWYYNGEIIKFSNEKEFNRILSDICYQIYPKTPTFKNEMVNKTKLSTSIATARKSLIRALVSSWDDDNLGFPKDKFPPEKTIFLTLIKEGGFVKINDDGQKELGRPTNPAFISLWEQSEEFLNTAKTGKRNLQDFKDMLFEKPLKLKKGFVDFWIPIYLFIKRDDFALFEKDVYIPTITDQVLEIVNKNPHKYYIKAFNIEGINLSLFKKYRTLLGQKERIPSSQSFIETIKPFLTFYKGLTQYAKKTKRLPKATIAFREAIAKARNPEKTFFNDFPTALGYGNLNKLEQDADLLNTYIDGLYQSLQEIRRSFDELQDRFENFICDFLAIEDRDSKDYRKVLQGRFKHLRHHLLQQRQKTLLQRINSDLDRNSWLNAVCQACIGKTLNAISDADEPLLYDKFEEHLKELDNLLEISKIKKNNEDDTFVSVEIIVPQEDKQKRIVRLPKAKKKALDSKVKEIRAILGNDLDVNIGVLTKLLNEFLDNDKS
jgi:ribosomal protein S15P/S13E